MNVTLTLLGDTIWLGGSCLAGRRTARQHPGQVHRASASHWSCTYTTCREGVVDARELCKAAQEHC